MPQPRTLGRAPRFLVLVGVALLLVTVSGCAAAAAPAQPAGAGAPGFLLGLWHGLIAPVAFVISIFNDSLGIYATSNAGTSYDAGFIIGIGAFFGGLGSRRR